MARRRTERLRFGEPALAWDVASRAASCCCAPGLRQPPYTRALLAPWLLSDQSAADWLGNAGQFLAALVAAVALLNLVRGAYRRTVGRRWNRYARIERLATNGQISFFSSVLAEPPAMRRTVEATVTSFDNVGNAYAEPKSWLEVVWIDRDFYVHAVADEDETIHAYSVTTRSRRFRPKLKPPGGSFVERSWLVRQLGFAEKFKAAPAVKLGKTRFHDLGRPDLAACWIGTHNFHYFEDFWGGNPGLYQHFVYSINDAGYGAWDSDVPYDEMANFSWGFTGGIFDPRLKLDQMALKLDAANEEEVETQASALEEGDGDEFVDMLEGETEQEPLPAFYDAFRRRARFNTYTIIGPELALDDYPFFTPPPENYATIFGPNSFRIRTLARDKNL
jgi:hypothetical protein